MNLFSCELTALGHHYDLNVRREYEVGEVGMSCVREFYIINVHLVDGDALGSMQVNSFISLSSF